MSSPFLRDWIETLIEALRTTTTIHGTPPYTSRIFGIVGIALYVSSQKTYSQNGVLLKDDIDGWKVGQRQPRLRERDLFIGWSEASWAIILQSIAKTYLPNLPDETLRSVYRAHESKSTQNTSRLMSYLDPWEPQKAPAALQDVVRLHRKWREDLEVYIKTREEDGWKQAQEVPPDLPNQGIYIPVGNVDIERKTDLRTLIPHHDKYTLLAIYNEKGELVAKQKYLGPQFGKVDVSKLLPQNLREQLVEIVRKHLPTPEQRKQEILELQTPPSEFGKASAETWAGSFGGYYNPPCQLMWLAIQFLTRHSQSYEEAQLVLLSLSINLFLVAVLAWDIKYTFNQSRPIQDFRLMYPDLEIHQWDGTTTTGRHWLPYQPRNSPTPPFPDIVSGHSCFSAITANTILLWTQSTRANLPFEPIPSSLYAKISPTLEDPICPHTNGCEVVVSAGSSSIDPTISPIYPVVIPLQNWLDIASMIGKSRVYGGIHTESSNIVSQAVAQELVNLTREYFKVPSSR